MQWPAGRLDAGVRPFWRVHYTLQARIHNAGIGFWFYNPPMRGHTQADRHDRTRESITHTHDSHTAAQTTDLRCGGIVAASVRPARLA